MTKYESLGDTLLFHNYLFFPYTTASLPSIRDDDNRTAGTPETPPTGNRDTKAVPVSTVRIGTIVYFSSKFFQINTVSTFKPSSNDVIVYIQVYKDGTLVQHSESSYLYITYYHDLLPGNEADNQVIFLL